MRELPELPTHALTMWNPWAWLCANGHKPIESEQASRVQPQELSRRVLDPREQDSARGYVERRVELLRSHSRREVLPTAPVHARVGRDHRQGNDRRRSARSRPLPIARRLAHGGPIRLLAEGREAAREARPLPRLPGVLERTCRRAREAPERSVSAKTPLLWLLAAIVYTLFVSVWWCAQEQRNKSPLPAPSSGDGFGGPARKGDG